MLNKSAEADDTAKSDGWRRRAATAARMVVDEILPPRCFSCGECVVSQGQLCSTCWTDMSFITDPKCTRCGFPFEFDQGDGSLCGACLASPGDYDRARSVLAYADASRRMILAFKHGDRMDMATTFAQWMMRGSREYLEGTDLIVPVPLHRWRLWRRRYNQSALISEQLSKQSGIPDDPMLLTRIRATPTQGGLSRSARHRNVRGAFRVDVKRRPEIENKAILLVDDVMTTGATVSACAKTLRRAGAREIRVITLARVVLPAHTTI